MRIFRAKKFNEQPRWLQIVAVLTAATSVDFIWVLWIRAVAAQQLVFASLMAMLLGALSLFGITTVIEQKWAYPYWIVGLGAGTVLAMLAKVH